MPAMPSDRQVTRVWGIPRSLRRVPLLAALPWAALPWVALPGVADSARAASHLVRPDGGGSFPTIQAALIGAAPGDTVLLADGVFLGEGNRDLDPAGRALVIRSQSGQAALCIIDCEGSQADRHRGFIFHTGEGPSTAVEDLTIRNGWGHDDPYGLPEAGAILIQDAEPTLRRCILADNYADFGGAILIYGATAPAIHACTFTGNEARLDAGGINCRDQSRPVITDCIFTDNASGSRGGGVLADDDSEPQVLGCTFTGNYGDNGGGAFYGCGTSNPYLADCTMEGNSADTYGAGISGGCFGHILVERTIIAFSTVGPAVGWYGNATVTLQCCDLYGNAGGDWTAQILDQYGINGNFAADPLFCDRVTGDLRLNGESPCLPRNHPMGDPCGVIGAWPVGCPGSGVEEAVPAARLELAPACPNPSADAVALRFWLAPAMPGEMTSVAVRIHDAAGRVVRTLLARPLEPGEHEIVWDGADDGGARVGPGIYWCRLTRGELTRGRPILRVR